MGGYSQANGKLSPKELWEFPTGTVRITAIDITVMNALQFVREQQPCASIADVGEVTGMHRSSVYSHLLYLRSIGLVEWDPGVDGSIHPTVARRRSVGVDG